MSEPVLVLAEQRANVIDILAPGALREETQQQTSNHLQSASLKRTCETIRSDLVMLLSVILVLASPPAPAANHRQGLSCE
jgi:hypothetical protein